MFSLPDDTTMAQQIPEGSSPANPIRLSQISKKDFRSFLQVLVPMGGVPSCSTFEEWVGALRLANMWDFKEVRIKAVEGLKPLLSGHSLAEQILFAQKYENRSLFVSALTDAIISKTSASNLGKELKEAGIDPVIIKNIFSFKSCIIDMDIEFVKCDLEQDGHQMAWCKSGKHTYLTKNNKPYTGADYMYSCANILESPHDANRRNRRRVEETVAFVEWRDMARIIKGLRGDDDDD